MKIAVPYENGMIFQHFGHTKNFMIYDTEGGKVTCQQLLAADGAGHAALAGQLARENVEILLCGGIGGGARNALEDAGIRICGGVFDVADLAVDALLKGTLEYSPDAECEHHNHKGGHNCANDGCSE